ncbi:putative EAL and GGDEF domains family protein [Vibrio nigripulchritudo MADA3029]|uniref:bifunctional diguanylate cyclase/phosphodiesterase n=1 Tax=Vibrio TaxID=662 RepID=UPI0003B23630|nr:MULTISPECIES: EAL domain-containing protein [Vibrio]UAB70282.1 EAL domain-containing protein [Vibrio sp. SCSIO 43132]CCN36129.1 putative EAL and GGDEF domains family protein [Vibrio nigripulchritudo AM115]CCN39921.1 putative EAL and GGDEF domains family protein [Vibrio nigripulchritudo FTn2]CCN47452.1 putative EAL and GGDEF domains family protein [Vibrio nigripulchritudo MADA3020]CCN53253.1 putative EAL and GGDEF domains family protein [Vibrio nigripulchritudo MADA3021]
MASNKITLRTAVILPFVIVFMFTFGVIAFVQKSSFENMVSNLSHKQLIAFTENVKSRLSIFLDEPYQANITLSKSLEFNGLYERGDLTRIEDYLSVSFNHLYKNIPHLDVVAFGGKEGEFVGFRREPASDFTLMLKDNRTEDDLVIFAGRKIESGVKSSFQGYDPRIRPWYVPAAESRMPGWSNIYTNADERQEITLSATNPVIVDDELIGVMVADIKIDTFNNFLIYQKKRTAASIFIFDQDSRLVAHSDNSSVVSKGTPNTVKGQRLQAQESPNPVIQASAQYILDNQLIARQARPEMFYFVTNGERYFNKLSRYANPYGLEWYIVVTIAEHDLLGDLPQQQQRGWLIGLTVSLVGFLLGVLVFNRITHPITTTANAAREIAKGDWDSPMPEPGKIFETSMLVSAFNNMTHNLKSSFEALRTQLVYDSLTQLYSRQGLIETSSNLNNSRPGSLILIGIDRFRDINDSLGHYSGDQLLTIIAQRLKNLCSDRALLARVAGDEFAIYDPSNGSETAVEHLVTRIKQSFSAPFNMGTETVVVNVSIGIVLSCDQNDMSTWLRNGSIALSHAKQDALRVVYYRPEMADVSRKKTQTLASLNEAIAASEFVPFYQPIIDLESGEIVGAEALARWVSEENGVIPPLDFIPVAEESGLIGDIGSQVLLKACTDTATAIQNGQWHPDFSLHVNLSVNQLSQPGFTEELEMVLKYTRLSAQNLTLEITESKIVDNDPIILKNMQAIKDLNVKIAIDDFGTGYSSLAYLHKLPFDCLKIDRSFIVQMEREQIDTSVVAAIVNITKGFKVNLVAEGVETTEQAELLRMLDCPQAQGFLFSRPVPFSEWPTDLVNIKEKQS